MAYTPFTSRIANLFQCRQQARRRPGVEIADRTHMDGGCFDNTAQLHTADYPIGIKTNPYLRQR